MPPEDEAGGVRDILICRHGETAWNRQRRVMGTLDIPLSNDGRRQCERLAVVLAGFGVTHVVSSPLARAAESARILGTALGLEISFDPDLEEVRFGRWQGMSYEEIRADPAYHRFVADPVREATPGGETVLDVQRRGLAALGRAPMDARTLFVSHGDIIRASLCHYLAIPIAEFRRMRIDNCSVSALSEANGHVEVKFVNTLPDPERAWDPVHWTRSI
jgi:probable phosphoglycerate mutase